MNVKKIIEEMRSADPAYRRFAIAVALATTAFAWPLFKLTAFALNSDLYSHVILIPFVSVGMIWMRRATLPSPGKPSVPEAAVTAVLAAGALLCSLLEAQTAAAGHHLTWTTTAYALTLVALGFWFLGRGFLSANIVAVAFLVFMIPMPDWLERATEVALQYASAEAADVLFSLAGLTYLREGQIFKLPSITMEIAQECSGIHSSLVLFITSIVAGQMFLPPGWRRWTLTLCVIPLAIVRNGFRVLTLGILCERIGPHMIDHWIHHRGGPIFFALSLIPFFALLFVLYRVGRNPNKKAEGGEHGPGIGVR
jgi:exosortase C (VPDSG-CTERM-specific)